MSKKKNVTITLDQQRTLKYSINAMIELEERFNVPIPELFKEDSVGFGLIVSVLKIGLVHGGMKLMGNSKQQEIFVGDLVQEHWINEGRNLPELMEKVTEAFNVAGIFTVEPNKDEGGEENPNQGTDDKTSD